MLSYISSLFASTTPSVLLVIGKFGATIHVLHLPPYPAPDFQQRSTIERFSLTMPPSKTTFHFKGATEQAREQIGTVTLHVGDGETPVRFFDDVETRIHKHSLAIDSAEKTQAGRVEVTRIMQNAALDAIHEREKRGYSTNATQAYPVFLVYVRLTDGRPLIELTSFP